MRWLLTLIASKDGSLSLTKLAAACFHFAIFSTACWLTYKTGEWKNEMWTLYAMVAVGHAAFDKTAAQVKAVKDKQIDAGGEPPKA